MRIMIGMRDLCFSYESRYELYLNVDLWERELQMNGIIRYYYQVQDLYLEEGEILVRSWEYICKDVYS